MEIASGKMPFFGAAIVSLAETNTCRRQSFFVGWTSIAGWLGAVTVQAYFGGESTQRVCHTRR